MKGLDDHLKAKTAPIANAENVVFWGDYRITVLQERLFRIERSPSKKFRDEATQAVWFRDMPKQTFSATEHDGTLHIQTPKVTCVIAKNRENCKIVLGKKTLPICNDGNLKGTYRTLDECDGDVKIHGNERQKITLGDGVCSRTGVAVLDDSHSLTLGVDGEVKPFNGDGTDEYVFAYGDDYRSAVKALYKITGKTPKIPRFALGNWWSRYHVYTDREYLTLLASFDREDVPLTVATIDMDWHYSTQMEADLHISALGKNTPFYGGCDGWTGYTWNQRLFPNYRQFLKKVKQHNVKITLNLHPADGVRWWESQYNAMATALGKDPSTQEKIPFAIADTGFINAYFSILHKPYERDGVDFWWVDWQQGTYSNMQGLDPLWSLNHYHYLDNAKENVEPLILSRYCGVGAHRYPLGFSGDTHSSWATLQYLPKFTATATNVGYTWWSHDIGGHFCGEKDDELYLRHLQLGVFSPVNRLHCSNLAISTKEPWAYGNGAGELAKKWLRFRHRLIPFLYSASQKNHADGVALIEPLYYEWKCKEAYRYDKQFLFGGSMMVAPVTQKAKKGGFARVDAWLPEGRWTDVFTGAGYEIKKGGKRLTLYREMDTIPVFIRAGSVLPLSNDSGNSVKNPKKMQVWAFDGNGEYTLYEDGLADGKKTGELYTTFTMHQREENEKTYQTLTLQARGDWSIVEKKRAFEILFKTIPKGKVTVRKNGKKVRANVRLFDVVAVAITLEKDVVYEVEVCYDTQTQLARQLAYAKLVMTMARGKTEDRAQFWNVISGATTLLDYETRIEKTEGVSKAIKNHLKETLP